jgi:AraC-like DNA-binding protein
MKALFFNVPAAHDKTLVVQEEILPHFYQHLHRHEEIQITLIQKGEGTLVVGDSVHKFGPNEIYFIGANIPHVFKSDPSYFDNGCEDNVHAQTLFFNPASGKLASLFELPELKNFSSFFENNYNGFRVPVSAQADIADKILGVKNSSQLEQLLRFFDLLKSLGALDNLSPLASQVVAKANTSYDRERMNNIYAYITSHYNKGLTLAMVAEKAYMTPPAFCRYFKKHTGLTFVSFLSEIRINEVCKKLSAGTYGSVSSVALNCGFTNIPNFNRVFKLVVGQSPSLYMSNFNSN